MVDIAGGVNPYRGTAAFHIDDVHGIPDHRSLVSQDPNLCRVTDLNCIAADGIKLIPGYFAAGVPGRSVEGVSPDSVSQDMLQPAVAHRKISGAFFKKNAAGRVVAALLVLGSAVRDGYAIDCDA